MPTVATAPLSRPSSGSLPQSSMPNTVSQSGYAKAVDRAMSRGEVALMFIDDGRQCQLSAQEGDIAPLICTDLWQAIKELAPNKVPSTQRLEHLTAAGRHLLHASVSVETWYGASALMKTKAVVAVDSEQEHFFLSELQKWGWFGFMPDNVVILPLPRFHGFAEDQRTGKLAHVKNSAKLMLGTGYALFLLNSPAEAYTLSVGGEPRCLSGSVLSWLDDQHTSWLFSGLFSDVQRLRPEALVDVDFLAAALYCADRGGCNMAMEVVQGEGERDVRVHDSIVLRRGDAGAGSCALRASAMRTVRSYQIIQQNVPVSAGGTGLLHVPGPYLCTQRYAFKVPALQQLLIDATQFHMDVVLYGFYAYANFDLSDITTARNSSCACILAGGHKGPPMVDVVLGKNWLSTTAAPVLEAQDKVAEFRRKAMELLRVERGGATSPGHQLPGLGFKERRAGFSVVLFLTMEHGTASLALAAMRMARLFVLNIVDRLHLVTIIGGADNRSTAKAMLDDMVDKELDFQGQVVREVITRESGPASGGRDTLGCMRTYCQAVSAKLVVVPSSRLASSSMTELGGASSSLALLVLRSLTTIPVLLVKANSVGRFATSVSRSISATGTSGGGGNLSSTGSLSSLSPASSLTQRPGLVVMCHLDTSQASTLVESITPFLVPSQDVLYLARTQAFEKPGQLSMRSRRMFVQARMAVANVLKVEERAYASTASAELPKAVEAEGVDLLVVSASGSLAPSKEVEDIVRAAKAAGIYVHRTVEGGQGPAGTLVNNLIVQMALKHAQAKGMASPSVLLVPAGGAVHPRVPLGRNRIASRPGSKALVCRAQAAPVTEVKKIVSSLEFDAPPPVSNDEINRTVLSIILGGGAGSRLYPLTKKRAKPAVPLGANYRLIDIPVSNCINSNITKIYTLTQFNSASLNRHLSQAYNSSVGGYNTRGFVEVLAASQSPLNKSWFQGTADAVRQYMWLFDEAVRDGVEDFLILSGDHLYRMDYRDFVRKHKESGAAITIAALPCNEKDASAFGLMKIDSTGKVVEFAEKPKGEALTKMRVDTTVLGVDAVTAKAKPYIASMGIYVMKASALKELLLTKMPDANDFGNEIIPGARESGMLVQTFAFEGYWEDIGTVEAFYNSNLALANPATAQFSFYDKKAPIYTMSRFLPPSKIQDAMVEHAIIGDGCVIKSGSSIKNSVVGIRSLIGHDCKIENALIMGSDYYETLEECEFVPGCLPMGVGDGSEVRRAIIDKNARIGENCKIINKEGVKEANRENDGWVIKDGIIVIIKDSVIPSGTII